MQMLVIRFDKISIIFIIFLLIMFLVGYKKGFISATLSIFSKIAIYITALYATSPLASFLIVSGYTDMMERPILNHLYSNKDIWNTIINKENSLNQIRDILNQLNFSWLPIDRCLNKMISYMGNSSQFTIGELMSKAIVYFVIHLIIFMGLSMIMKILFKVIKKLFTGVSKIKVLGKINGLMGGLLSFAIGILAIMCVNYVFALIVPLGNNVSMMLVKELSLNNPNVISFSKFMFENNYLLQIISRFI